MKADWMFAVLSSTAQEPFAASIMAAMSFHLPFWGKLVYCCPRLFRRVAFYLKAILGSKEMSRAGSVLVGISYPTIVVFAVLLLFAVQLRSSGGAAYDTWRLNFSANRYLESELTRAHQQLRDKANES